MLLGAVTKRGHLPSSPQTAIGLERTKGQQQPSKQGVSPETHRDEKGALGTQPLLVGLDEDFSKPQALKRG